MKILVTGFFLVVSLISFSQKRVNPVIENFGGIYDIPDAVVKPDPAAEYKIVIDVYGGSEEKNQIDRSLNNVARMLNLHAVGGVDPENMQVVLAAHGGSTYSILNDEAYNAMFGMDNPNTPLITELKEAGVKLTVCGQSLKGRSIENDQVNNNVELSTSMLTTVTKYQLLGYTLLKF
ncbi:MAG: DsrE family protein [Cyclobacteriaceae bacterium]